MSKLSAIGFLSSALFSGCLENDVLFLYWYAVLCFGNQILLFAVASEAPKFLPIFKEAAKPFKGPVIFLLVCPVFDEPLALSMAPCYTINMDVVCCIKLINYFLCNSCGRWCGHLTNHWRGACLKCSFCLSCGAGQWGSWWTCCQLLGNYLARDHSNAAYVLSSLFLRVDLSHINRSTNDFDFTVSDFVFNILIRLLCRSSLTLGMKMLRSVSLVVWCHWTTLR